MFDTFWVSVTKIDPSFPGSQFSITGYIRFCKDRNVILHVIDKCNSFGVCHQLQYSTRNR